MRVLPQAHGPDEGCEEVLVGLRRATAARRLAFNAPITSRPSCA